MATRAMQAARRAASDSQLVSWSRTARALGVSICECRRPSVNSRPATCCHAAMHAASGGRNSTNAAVVAPASEAYRLLTAPGGSCCNRHRVPPPPPSVVRVLLRSAVWLVAEAEGEPAAESSELRALGSSPRRVAPPARAAVAAPTPPKMSRIARCSLGPKPGNLRSARAVQTRPPPALVACRPAAAPRCAPTCCCARCWRAPPGAGSGAAAAAAPACGGGTSLSLNLCRPPNTPLLASCGQVPGPGPCASTRHRRWPAPGPRSLD